MFDLFSNPFLTKHKPEVKEYELQTGNPFINLTIEQLVDKKRTLNYELREIIGILDLLDKNPTVSFEKGYNVRELDLTPKGKLHLAFKTSLQEVKDDLEKALGQVEDMLGSYQKRA